MILLDFFSNNWCELKWSEWITFNKQSLDSLSDENKKKPGLYRIRPVGKTFLVYIGQTSRALRKRLSELCRHSQAKEFPWNDPHTAAQSLLIWSQSEGFSYEFSIAPIVVSTKERLGWESFLLAKYRQESGESTLCNFGRFHKRYRKSTGRKKRNGEPGIKGGRLENSAKDNPAGGPSMPPLRVIGKPGDEDWMGLTWTDRKPLNTGNIGSLSSDPGLYLLSDAGSGEILYIGQSKNCSKRLQDHSRKQWDEKSLQFSCYLDPGLTLAHNLKELENDLIGNYFEVYRKAPEFQFSNK